MKSVFDHLARSAESLESMDERWRREHPWLTITSFVEGADELASGFPQLEGIVIEARDVELARRLIDGAVVSALERCKQLLDEVDSTCRV
jgi:hypothetical protein